MGARNRVRSYAIRQEKIPPGENDVKPHAVIIIVAAVAVMIEASPVAAQSPRVAQAGNAGILPSYEIVTIVRSTGLNPLSRPIWRNGKYVLRAIDTRGVERRVVVDAYRGEILSAVPVVRAMGSEYFEADAGRYRSGPRVLPADPLIDDYEVTGSVPRPPRSVPRVITPPNGGISSTRSAAIVPARPPLPRPRPATTPAAMENPALAPVSPHLSASPQDEPKMIGPKERDDATPSAWPPVAPLE